jgi:hypothetical protein
MKKSITIKKLNELIDQERKYSGYILVTMGLDQMVAYTIALGRITKAIQKEIGE